MELRLYTNGPVGTIMAEVGRARIIFAGSYKVIMTRLELNFTLSLFQFLNGGGMKIDLEHDIKISIELYSLSFKLQWGVGPKKQPVNSLLKI